MDTKVHSSDKRVRFSVCLTKIDTKAGAYTNILPTPTLERIKKIFAHKLKITKISEKNWYIGPFLRVEMFVCPEREGTTGPFCMLQSHINIHSLQAKKTLVFLLYLVGRLLTEIVIITTIAPSIFARP